LKQKETNTGSTEYQRQLKQVAASYGWPEHLIELSEEDVGTSSRATKRRTGWQKILKEIGEDLVGAVFIVNSSRMARQYEYYADFRKLAARHNVLIFMDDRLINLRDLGDTLYSNMSAFVAEISSLIQTEHMRRSRLAKAKTGTAVSSLPVGWIKRPDKSFDFDPVVKPSIDLVISIFREKRTLHGTVRELLKHGTKLPVKRKAGRIDWLEPSLERVKGMIVNPAYTGTYLYGKTESALELGLRSNGQAIRKRTRPEDWIVVRDHHPAYINVEEQQEFLRSLTHKAFSQRHRPGRGPALIQGVVECARCGSKLSVGYGSKPGYFSYRCTRNSVSTERNPA
jgi:DNA invertase Pin-like site-specific DNA recombinase